MRRHLLLLPLLLACRPPAPAEPPEKVVEGLYGSLFVASIAGAPDSAGMARIRPFLSDTLAALLVAADAERTADLARAPNEKPSWAEGNIFVSLFEGPTAFYLQPGIPDGRGFKVPVVGQYQPVGDTARTVWTDTAVVVAERGKWVVTDVIYGGKWDFAPKGRLRENLVQ
jgi:hypothetical protein